MTMIPTCKVGGSVITYEEFVRKLWKHFTDDRLEICHSAMGVTGEAGELCDALKRVAIYGKEVDRDNVVEELGDLRFFMQTIMNRYQITDEEILDANREKLSKRYNTLTYTDEAAIARADKVITGKEHYGVDGFGDGGIPSGEVDKLLVTTYDAKSNTHTLQASEIPRYE